MNSLGGLLAAAGQLLAAVAAVAAVCALAFVSLWVMRRLQAAAGGPAEAAPLRFVRAMPVGARERLVVVEWRGQTLLLGVTAGGIQLLDRRDAPEADVAADAVEAAATVAWPAAWRMAALGRTLARGRP